MKQRQSRRLSWALVASLVLHALLLVWVLWAERGQAPKTSKSQAIEFDLVVREDPKPPPPPVPVPAPQPVAPQKQATAKKRQAAEVAAVEAPVSSAQPPTVSVVEAPADVPRKGAFLVPRVSTVLPGLGRDPDGMEARGRTVRNSPAEQVDEEAVREYTAERAQKRLDDELGAMVAKAQRENGLVAPYFTHLQQDLRDGFKGKDVKLAKRSTATMLREEVVETYTGPAERFAKTGSPLADNEQSRQFTESSFGRTLEHNGRQAGDIEGQRMLQAGLQSMAFTAVLKDSAARARLKTVLMLVQDGDGALAEATVVEHSGDSEFDEFVLHLSRKVVRDQGDTSENGGAPSALGWSSLWQFTWEPPEVKVKLLRVLKSKGPLLQ